MADYGQLFCEAVDTIVQERLSGIKFDNTIVGIIVDDKDKAQGKYVVSYGQAKFEAYSLNDVKYNIHNNVYVQIPQDDWNEQKFIIGRKADDENVPVNYQYPFDSFIDITGNLLVNTPNITSGLIANGLYDNNELKKGSDSEIIWSYNIPKLSEDDTVERPFGEQFSKYTRLGIQAQFRSWLAEDQAVSGSYGLRLRIEAEREDQQDIDLKNQDEGAGSVEVSTETVYYDLLLDAADMIGNPYSFDTYFQQEKLFDISDIYRINKMELQFYQKGDFKNKEGIIFDPYQDSNLFVKDIYISLGYDANNFENDTAMIYSFDSSKYTTIANPAESNHKKIQIRWIHRLENNVIKSIDITDQIDYTITWYKYKLGAYSYTPQSGPDWIPLSSQTVKWNAVNDELNRAVEFKILDQNWLDYNVNADIKYYREPGFNYTWLLPDVTESEEYIKAIISYTINDKAVYVKSDPLKFTNREPVVSKPTVDAVSALSIVCEDNSFGNYRIYNQGNELLNPADGQVERIFTAYFKGAPLSNAEEIEWIIPTQNSMIVLENEYYSPDRSWDDTGRVHLKRYGDKAKKYDISQVNNQRYKIKRYFNQTSANNIIQCKIKKDNITYTATKELTFGVAGTNGSDHTLIIDFDDGFTAIPYLISDLLKQGKPNFEKVKSPLVKEQYYGLTARLYDFENKEIDFSSIANYTIEWGFEIAPKTNSALSFKNETTYIEVIKRDKDGNPLYKDKDKTEYQYDSIPDSTGSKKNLYVDYTKLNMNQLYIVKATLRWRDAQSVKVQYKDENGKTQNKDIKPQILTAFLPIPIYKYFETDKASDTGLEHIIQPAFIGGATQVVYMSNGYPNYYKDAYQIFYNEYNEFEDKTLIIKKTEEWKNNISWYVIGQSKAALDEYAPECDTDGNLTKQKNCLKPSGIYIKDADPYGVQCKLKGDPIWTQPIFVTMNRYPNSMINKWDGKTLTLNEDSGSILSTAIAAGKKESWMDNGVERDAFTGVMLGDWSSSTLGDIEESLVKTGIYGFHRGEQSFAFTEDGKAFIGKSGRGRIHLDGDKSLIESEKWQQDLGGMSLDLDDGILTMKDGNRNILLSAKQSTYPLSIGKESSVASQPFRVTWNGKLYATNAYIEGTIESSYIYGGTIIGGTITGGTITGTTITGGSVFTDQLYGGIAHGYIYKQYLKKGDKWEYESDYTFKTEVQTNNEMENGKKVFYNHDDIALATVKYVYEREVIEAKQVKIGSMDGSISYRSYTGTLDANGKPVYKDETTETVLVGMTTYKSDDSEGELADNTAALVFKSKQRIALFTENTILIKSPKIHIWDPSADGEFVLDGYPANKQFGIYARFA